MKNVVLMFLFISFLSGCTSIKPTEMSSTQLQQEIRSKEIVNSGDTVKIVLDDGSRKEFRVIDIDENYIVGKNESIEIARIVALESREFSWGKTALLAGGGILVYGYLFAAALGALMVGL